MFTQMQTSPTNELCLNILNEAGLFVLNIYKWSFKHAIGRTSLKSLQKATRKRLPGDNSSSAANEQRKGDNKQMFSSLIPLLSAVWYKMYAKTSRGLLHRRGETIKRAAIKQSLSLVFVAK